MNRRLIDYLPPILRAAPPLRAVTDTAEQNEFAVLWDAVDMLLDQQFIDSASDFTLARWEAMLHLPPLKKEGCSENEWLGARRAAITARLREQPPHTRNTLYSTLEAMCGSGRFELIQDYSNYTLRLRVTPLSPASEVRAMLARVLPANILLDFGILFMSYTRVGTMRNSQLAPFTHTEIRNMSD